MCDGGAREALAGDMSWLLSSQSSSSCCSNVFFFVSFLGGCWGLLPITSLVQMFVAGVEQVAGVAARHCFSLKQTP